MALRDNGKKLATIATFSFYFSGYVYFSHFKPARSWFHVKQVMNAGESQRFLFLPSKKMEEMIKKGDNFQ